MPSAIGFNCLVKNAPAKFRLSAGIVLSQMAGLASRLPVDTQPVSKGGGAPNLALADYTTLIQNRRWPTTVMGVLCEADIPQDSSFGTPTLTVQGQSERSDDVLNATGDIRHTITVSPTASASRGGRLVFSLLVIPFTIANQSEGHYTPYTVNTPTFGAAPLKGVSSLTATWSTTFAAAASFTYHLLYPGSYYMNELTNELLRAGR
jgi:hypothetical protein